MKNLSIWFILLWVFAPVPCFSENLHGSVSDEVLARWLKDNSYYALVEIVDAYIDPQYSSAVSKARVRELLGPGMDRREDYPGASENRWIYPSSRHVPYGSYLIIEFNEAGNVRFLEWASE